MRAAAVPRCVLHHTTSCATAIAAAAADLVAQNAHQRWLAGNGSRLPCMLCIQQGAIAVGTHQRLRAAAVARCVFIMAVNSCTSCVVMSTLSAPSAHDALAATNALHDRGEEAYTKADTAQVENEIRKSFRASQGAIHSLLLCVCGLSISTPSATGVTRPIPAHHPGSFQSCDPGPNH